MGQVKKAVMQVESDDMYVKEYEQSVIEYIKKAIADA